MKKKRVTFSYISGVVSSGGINLPINSVRSEVSSNVKSYFNATHKIAKLPRHALLLLNYLTETMDENNMVANTSYHRMEFIEHIKSTCSINFAESTVIEGIKILKAEGLLIIQAQRSMYMVNPRHYYAGSERDRKKLLKKVYTDVSLRKYNKPSTKAALGI